jgi:hypothetical protein
MTARTAAALSLFALASAADPIVVDGALFKIEAFGNGARGFNNRKYLWQGIPERFQGWQFTRTYGGRQACIEFEAAEAGPVFVATATHRASIIGKDWQATEHTFTYSTGNPTRMTIYTRACAKGERVSVPQGNWSGAVLLAPKLKMGRTYPILGVAPPGTVISRSPDPQRQYVGSPSITVVPNGDYVASHDWFGPATSFDTTFVFRSTNKGVTWQRVAELKGQFWSTLFVHDKALYILGNSKRFGAVVIRRSNDGGDTWTTPAGPENGILLPESIYHCAPVPVVVHGGRVWRAMEDQHGREKGWGRWFRTFAMSAPTEADLLKAASWATTNRLASDPAWDPAKMSGWLEGNVVPDPQGKLVNILRYETQRGEIAALCRISADGTTQTFDPDSGFIELPGGRSKFTIRYDAKSKRYWSLVNKQRNPIAVRNVLALVSSADLREWRTESILLMHPDSGNHAFQYPDWVFDGDHILAASRTAWGDAHSMHDANYLTFHRVRNFRDPAERRCE